MLHLFIIVIRALQKLERGKNIEVAKPFSFLCFTATVNFNGLKSVSICLCLLIVLVLHWCALIKCFELKLYVGT